MKEHGFAFFVKRPRTIDDLHVPHLKEKERPYEIVKIIQLGIMDYENFITDMLADRPFIEEYSSLCERAETWKCLLVCRRGQSDGVLVMPERNCFVGWAGFKIDLHQV